ncbi:MAG: HU family DNA-binding protein [Bacteroides sp.]
MPINYVVTKKVDKSQGTIKELYYATTRAIQKRPIDSSRIAQQLAERSSLQDGDAMSVLVQLSDIIAQHLQEGRTVKIDGLGNFYPTISSEGVEKPEECTAEKVRVARICFKAAPTFLKRVKRAGFFSFQLQEEKKEIIKRKKKADSE